MKRLTAQEYAKSRVPFRVASYRARRPEVVSDDVARPAFRYYGGKFRLADWIISHLPNHACYVEPFAGAASIFLQKPLAKFNVINDLNGEIVNFFCVLRERPALLIGAIETTPYSRIEHAASRNGTINSLERARRFYVRMCQSFGSGTRRQPGWRFHYKNSSPRADATLGWRNTGYLWSIADKLRYAHIECDTALETIRRFDAPETLFYLDPPYPHETRSQDAREGYSHEMTNQDHRQLADALQNIEGMAVVSGYNCPLYEEIFDGWERKDKQTIDLMANERVESLWLSPSASKALEAEKRKVDAPLLDWLATLEAAAG